MRKPRRQSFGKRLIALRERHPELRVEHFIFAWPVPYAGHAPVHVAAAIFQLLDSTTQVVTWGTAVTSNRFDIYNRHAGHQAAVGRALAEAEGYLGGDMVSTTFTEFDKVRLSDPPPALRAYLAPAAAQLARAAVMAHNARLDDASLIATERNNRLKYPDIALLTPKQPRSRKRKKEEHG